MKNLIYILPVIVLGIFYFIFVKEKEKEKQLNDLAKKEIETLLEEFNRQGEKFPTLKLKVIQNYSRGFSAEQTLIREAIYIAMEEREGRVGDVVIPRYVWLNILHNAMK
jgi:hypothetical protein